MIQILSKSFLLKFFKKREPAVKNEWKRKKSFLTQMYMEFLPYANFISANFITATFEKIP